MTEKEKTAPNELAATSSEQSSTDKSIITNDDKKVKESEELNMSTVFRVEKKKSL